MQPQNEDVGGDTKTLDKESGLVSVGKAFILPMKWGMWRRAKFESAVLPAQPATYLGLLLLVLDEQGDGMEEQAVIVHFDYTADSLDPLF